jgi:hypothetical protein
MRGTMNATELLDVVRTRPGMLGLDRSFGQTAAFVNGLNEGQDGKFLIGFREWLVVRANLGADLAWEGLVDHIASPGQVSRSRSADDDEHARDVLLDLLSEFLAARERRQGLLKIYDAYGKWLRRQSWYEPGFPLYFDDDENAASAEK